LSFHPPLITQIGQLSRYHSELNQALIAAQQEWKVAAVGGLISVVRNFNALPPEQRALIKTARSEAEASYSGQTRAPWSELQRSWNMLHFDLTLFV
jgi:hypothetical protein